MPASPGCVQRNQGWEGMGEWLLWNGNPKALLYTAYEREAAHPAGMGWQNPALRIMLNRGFVACTGEVANS